MDLVFIDGITFENKNFTEEFLDKGDYSDCNYYNCNFYECDLSNYNFTDCQFIDCNLSMVNLFKTSFNSILFFEFKINRIAF